MTEFSLKRIIQKQVAKTELSKVLIKLSNIFGNYMVRVMILCHCLNYSILVSSGKKCVIKVNFC